jgi:hypothetical protein
MLERGYDCFGLGALEYANDCYKAAGKEKGKSAHDLLPLNSIVPYSFFGYFSFSPYLIRLPNSASASRSGEIEPVKVHYLGPSRYEIVKELLLRVLTSVNFRYGPQLGVRT